MTDARPPLAPLLAAAVPPVALTLAVLVFAAGEMAGTAPLSAGPVRNVAEAAAMGMAPEVLRLLEEGQDPNQVWTIRRDIISSTITRVTALEAAVWSRHVQLVELLDREGAIVGEQSRRHLACLAGDLPVQDIVDYLSPGRPPDCVAGQAIDAVLKRSPE